MGAPQNVVALVFDFDDTLTDDSTTQFLKSKDIDVDKFWKVDWKRLLEEGWNPSQAYLKLLLDLVGEGKPLGKVTNKMLAEFGPTLKFYQGLPELFDELKELVKEHKVTRPDIEFYIVSGGLEDIIRGSSIAKHCSGIWANRFAEEAGAIKYVTNVVTFTEKTRYIFEINKGVADRMNDPYAVNRAVPEGDRRVPIRNMIYVGDGVTDVPCFSLVGKFGGQTFGVFDPAKKDKPKIAVQELIGPKRVGTVNSPRYKADDDLGALLRAAVKKICIEMDLKTQAPLGRMP
jgi:phosphoserine phosphatase